FKALVVGFTVNNLLPLRMGEVARAYLLSRWCRIPYGATIASLVVERVLDGLSLAVLLLVSLAFLPAPGYLLVVGVLAAGGFLAAAALLAIVAWLRRDVRRRADQCPARCCRHCCRPGRGVRRGRARHPVPSCRPGRYAGALAIARDLRSDHSRIRTGGRAQPSAGPRQHPA